MIRALLVVRTILSLVFGAFALVQLWYCVRLWHDLMDRAVYVLDENTITTTTAGVQLSFYGGLIALLLATAGIRAAFLCWPWVFVSEHE